MEFAGFFQQTRYRGSVMVGESTGSPNIIITKRSKHPKKVNAG
jgi:hypothetical protein